MLRSTTAIAAPAGRALVTRVVSAVLCTRHTQQADSRDAKIEGAADEVQKSFHRGSDEDDVEMGLSLREFKEQRRPRKTTKGAPAIMERAGATGRRTRRMMQNVQRPHKSDDELFYRIQLLWSLAKM